MNYRELTEAVAEAGLDVSRLVSRQEAGNWSKASPEVGYNFIVGRDGVRIVSGAGRGTLVATPYEGYVFADEQAACEFVWRMIRASAAPQLLTETERETNRLEALEILTHVS